MTFLRRLLSLALISVIFLYNTSTIDNTSKTIASVDSVKDTSSFIYIENNNPSVDSVKDTSSFVYIENNNPSVDTVKDTSSFVYIENNNHFDETTTSISLGDPGDLTFNFTENDSIFEVKSVYGSFFFYVNDFQDDTIVKKIQCDDLSFVTIMYVNLSDINKLFGLHSSSSLWNLGDTQDILAFIEEKNIYAGMYGNIKVTENLNLCMGRTVRFLTKPQNDPLEKSPALLIFVSETGKIVWPLSVEIGANDNNYF